MIDKFYFTLFFLYAFQFETEVVSMIFKSNEHLIKEDTVKEWAIVTYQPMD